MELFTALQAVDFRDVSKMSPCTKKIYDFIRKSVSFIEEDVIMYKKIHKVQDLINTNEFNKLIGLECE